MQINDLYEMVLNMPRMLAAGWGVWLFVGLLLSIWGRREKDIVAYYSTTKHKSGARAAAGTKPPSGVRAPVKPSSSPSVPVTASAGDAFGDLERLLEPEVGSHRTPGERSSPVLAEVTGSNGAALAAPQSLP